jgi:transposase
MSDDERSDGESRRRYPKEFKVQAVEQSFAKGSSVSAVARELGIPRTMLCRWRSEYAADPAHAFRGNGVMTAEQRQIRTLQREVERLRRERDSLIEVVGSNLVTPSREIDPTDSVP